MICSICGKNEATIHFKGIFNDQTVKLYLCDECARKKGMEFKSEFPIADFISTISDLGLPSITKTKKTLSCSACGLTYSEFRRTGRLGCVHCYHVFGHYLTHLLERIHGKARHVGKRTNAGRTQNKSFHRQKLSGLKKELEQAIKSEKYEKAAELRDEIEQFKNKVS